MEKSVRTNKPNGNGRPKNGRKIYCPVCGSTYIRGVNKRYVCSNCKSHFLRPATTEKEDKKKVPRYIR